jgi:hypothetical protein
MLDEEGAIPASMAGFSLAGYGSFMDPNGDQVYGVFNDGLFAPPARDRLMRGGIGWGLGGVSIVGAPNYNLWDLARPG